jgi:hypothetical protein
MGQTHQWQVGVVLWQRFPVAEDFHSLKAAEQTSQRRLDFQKHLCPLCRHGASEAGELDRIPKPYSEKQDAPGNGVTLLPFYVG